MKKANKNSWKNLAMPAEYKIINFDHKFTQQEYDQISQGLIPQAMEDKWFIFFEDNKIYFHRSWTGYCIFITELVLKNEHYEITKVVSNRDSNQHKSNEENDINILKILISNLVGKNDRKLYKSWQNANEKRKQAKNTND